jgi:signal transduction histidine kinase
MLRTPLNSIKGAAYLLNRNEAQNPLQWDQYHDIITNETDKLIGAVENLLDFLRLKEEGPAE